MKKYLSFAVWCSCLLAACTSSPQYNLTGTLTGIQSDTLLVRSFAINPLSRPQIVTDTVPLKDGKFALQLGDSVLKQVVIMEKPSLVPDAQGRIPAISMDAISFILLPGKKVVVNGSLDGYTLGGDAFYDTYSQLLTQKKVYEHKLDSLRDVCREMEQKGIAEDSIRRVYAPAEGWERSMTQVSTDYIRRHPNQDLSVFLLAQTPLDLEVVDSLLKMLSENVRTGVMQPLYQTIQSECEKGKARQQALEKVKEGMPAPDFTLKDIQGNDFSLSSAKGKYVILDFWGSWCGWCIKGLPDMKKAYRKYKHKVVFVGIDCNDTEEKWKQAVAAHGIPWVNVRNAGQPDVAVMYGVSGYPTKIVIDRQGNIQKRVVGEDGEFYEYLDEIMR